MKEFPPKKIIYGKNSKKKVYWEEESSDTSEEVSEGADQDSSDDLEKYGHQIKKKVNKKVKE